MLFQLEVHVFELSQVFVYKMRINDQRQMTFKVELVYGSFYFDQFPISILGHESQVKRISIEKGHQTLEILTIETISSNRQITQ